MSSKIFLSMDTTKFEKITKITSVQTKCYPCNAGITITGVSSNLA